MSVSRAVECVRHRCHKTLPLVYDEALSYYESVCKLTAKINEMVEVLNNVTVDVLDDAYAYTDKAVADGLADVNKSVEEVYSVRDELNAQYAEFMRLTNAQLLLFNNRMNGFNKQISDAVVGVNARTDLAIQQNNEYLLEELSKGLVDVKVVNFFTGQTVGIQSMFDYLAMLHVDGSIDYDGLIAKGLTYTALVGKDITYTDLVLHGSTLL